MCDGNGGKTKTSGENVELAAQWDPMGPQAQSGWDSASLGDPLGPIPNLGCQPGPKNGVNFAQRLLGLQD